MLDNVRICLEQLNNISFSNQEWQRFVETYLDKASDRIEALTFPFESIWKYF
jgi:type I restriction enzyme R subunit